MVTGRSSRRSSISSRGRQLTWDRSGHLEIVERCCPASELVQAHIPGGLQRPTGRTITDHLAPVPVNVDRVAFGIDGQIVLGAVGGVDTRGGSENESAARMLVQHQAAPTRLATQKLLTSTPLKTTPPLDPPPPATWMIVEIGPVARPESSHANVGPPLPDKFASPLLLIVAEPVATVNAGPASGT